MLLLEIDEQRPRHLVGPIGDGLIAGLHAIDGNILNGVGILLEEGKAEVKLINGSANINLEAQSLAKLGEFGGVNKDRIGSGTYFERYVKGAEESVKTMKMASESISRLADEYPDYRLSVFSTNAMMYITISLS